MGRAVRTREQQGPSGVGERRPGQIRFSATITLSREALYEQRPAATTKGTVLARPNHQFEKRQRELAKKKKKEEKRRRKLEQKSNKTEGGTPVAPDGAASEEPTA